MKDAERDGARDRIVKEWEQLVKKTATKVMGKKLIICSRAVKWWDDEVMEAMRVRRGVRKVYIE